MTSAQPLSLSPQHPIAYVCAEYAIDDLLPIYAGGLGILAGDMILEAQEMNVPFVALGLFYQKGFVSYPQKETIGQSLDPKLSGFTLVPDVEGKPLVLGVHIGEREVYFKTWTKSWGSASMYLLDTRVEENTNESDKAITTYLYPEDFDDRISQEIILGVGGISLFRALGISPSIYHLNEGHTIFAALALILEELKNTKEPKTFTQALGTVKPLIVGTKHTILPGAGIFFTKEQCVTYLGRLLKEAGADEDEFFSLGMQDGTTDLFSTTHFLLQSSIRVNAVSRLHSAFEKKAYPNSQELIPITNGISKKRWMLPALASDLSDEQLWQEHMKAKKELALQVRGLTGAIINPEALTIVWARRIAEYKRPLLMFQDMERLGRIIGNTEKPVTILISGNAYGWDSLAIKLLEDLLQTIRQLNQKGVVYLPDYSSTLSRKLVSAADLWLNTPIVGKEASGTSGMKSAINGALQLSVADGWFGEVKGEDCFWTLDSEHTAESLYQLLEGEVVPSFYARDDEGYPRQWISKMRKTRAVTLERYTSRRMLEDYVSQLYFPSVS